MDLMTLPRRQVGESNVDLYQSLPQIGKNSPSYDYQTALRQRLGTATEIGQQQNAYSARKRDERDAAAYAQRLSQIQSASNAQNWPDAQGMPVAGKGWFSPVQGFKPTFGYGQHYSNKALGDVHHGIDFATPYGTPIYAPSNGKVILAGWDPYGGKSGGFGTSLRLQNQDGTYTIIGHLSKILKNIKAGSKITPGMLLGYSGNSGNSSGNHTHIEFRRGLYDPNSSFDFSYLFGW